jgi:hypothetical protein
MQAKTRQQEKQEVIIKKIEANCYSKTIRKRANADAIQLKPSSRKQKGDNKRSI